MGPGVYGGDGVPHLHSAVHFAHCVASCLTNAATPGVCSAPDKAYNCSTCYDAKEKRQFWGFVSCIINADKIVNGADSRLRSLQQQVCRSCAGSGGRGEGIKAWPPAPCTRLIAPGVPLHAVPSAAPPLANPRRPCTHAAAGVRLRDVRAPGRRQQLFVRQVPAPAAAAAHVGVR